MGNTSSVRCKYSSISSVQGKRDTMEDSHSVKEPLLHTCEWDYYSMFDGHNGSLAADYCANQMSVNIANFLKVAIRRESLQNKTVSKQCDQSSQLLFKVLKTAFVRTDACLQGYLDSDDDDDDDDEENDEDDPKVLRKKKAMVTERRRVRKESKKQEISETKIGSEVQLVLDPSDAVLDDGLTSKERRTASACGTTAQAVLIHRSLGKVVIAHAGDTRGVWARRDGMCKQLTADHKPEELSEKQRILKAGSTVHNGRLNEVLGVSRSIGLASMKSKEAHLPLYKRALTPVPDVLEVHMKPPLYTLACIARGKTLCPEKGVCVGYGAYTPKQAEQVLAHSWVHREEERQFTRDNKADLKNIDLIQELASVNAPSLLQVRSIHALILACDGLWDVVSSQEACDFVNWCLRKHIRQCAVAVRQFLARHGFHVYNTPSDIWLQLQLGPHPDDICKHTTHFKEYMQYECKQELARAAYLPSNVRTHKQQHENSTHMRMDGETNNLISVGNNNITTHAQPMDIVAAHVTPLATPSSNSTNNTNLASPTLSDPPKDQGGCIPSVVRSALKPLLPQEKMTSMCEQAPKDMEDTSHEFKAISDSFGTNTLAALLTERAIEKGSKDNVSVMLVLLDPLPGLAKADVKAFAKEKQQLAKSLMEKRKKMMKTSLSGHTTTVKPGMNVDTLSKLGSSNGVTDVDLVLEQCMTLNPLATLYTHSYLYAPSYRRIEFITHQIKDVDSDSEDADGSIVAYQSAELKQMRQKREPSDVVSLKRQGSSNGSTNSNVVPSITSVRPQPSNNNSNISNSNSNPTIVPNRASNPTSQHPQYLPHPQYLQHPQYVQTQQQPQFLPTQQQYVQNETCSPPSMTRVYSHHSSQSSSSLQPPMQYMMPRNNSNNNNQNQMGNHPQNAMYCVPTQGNANVYTPVPLRRHPSQH